MSILAQCKAFTNSPLWVLLVFALPVVGMAIFAVQQAMRGGVVISERVKRAGGSIFLGPWIMEYGYWSLSVPVRWLIRFKISPNAISLGGFAVVLTGCILAAAGFFGLAGPLLLLGSLADMLDGIVARERGLCSDAGEFFDSIVDRYADVALFAGLCVYYAGNPVAMLVVLLGLLGSVMVSYARAKAESLGVHDAPGGPMRRAERAVYLGFSVCLAPLPAYFFEAPLGAVKAQPTYYLVLLTCSVIGLLANVHAVQMTLFVERALRQKHNLAPCAAQS
jgi:CDP-diacylglycerol--glycerol-3-phosphate 3-phosphatidyltransferase